MRTLITGGAGFIGTNLASHLLEKRRKVIIFDNLSRLGSEKNLFWLKDNFGDKFTFLKADIRNREKVNAAVKGVDVVYHLAAQVAVTKSLDDPITDFEINATGTLNLLEAVRRFRPQATVIFASTNKVYGALEGLRIQEKETRYLLPDYPEGIDERTNISFYSPYGCSKGAADQYAIDYSRIYGLKTVVFRQSCIYGFHQFGNEDQGWVAYLTLCGLKNKEITIYGDGKQVRDILFVDDLISAFLAAESKAEKIKGEVFNIGGGKENTISLLELLAWLKRRLRKKIKYRFSHWRPGDQKVYVSDLSKAKRELGWCPMIKKEEGLGKLLSWLKENI